MFICKNSFVRCPNFPPPAIRCCCMQDKYLVFGAVRCLSAYMSPVRTEGLPDVIMVMVDCCVDFGIITIMGAACNNVFCCIRLATFPMFQSDFTWSPPCTLLTYRHYACLLNPGGYSVKRCPQSLYLYHCLWPLRPFLITF